MPRPRGMKSRAVQIEVKDGDAGGRRQKLTQIQVEKIGGSAMAAKPSAEEGKDEKNDEGKDGGVEATMGLRAQKQRVRDAKLHMIATRLRTSSVCVVYAA